MNRRTILKQELARRLYPDSISPRSALKQLRNEINTSLELKENLQNAGHMSKHYYNKQQVALILEHLCLSAEEFENIVCE